MYGAFRALAPNFWGPFLLSLHRFMKLPEGYLMSLMSFDLTSSPLWILVSL